jgi:hypothetical protein
LLAGRRTSSTPEHRFGSQPASVLNRPIPATKEQAQAKIADAIVDTAPNRRGDSFRES